MRPIRRITLAVLTIIPAVLATVALVPRQAQAQCTDPAEPGVNWRRCFFNGWDLKGVDLTGAMLRDAAFGRAQMDGANLSRADAYRAKFNSAKLPGVRFDGTRLIEADFTRADLSGASFKDADLRNAKLVDANLSGADFSGAQLGGADFRQANLSGARWIDRKRRCGENSIGQCN